MFYVICVCFRLTHIVLCFCFVILRLVYLILPVSLDCSFVIAPSVFSDVCLPRKSISKDQSRDNGIITLLVKMFVLKKKHIFDSIAHDVFVLQYTPVTIIKFQLFWNIWREKGLFFRSYFPTKWI